MAKIVNKYSDYMKSLNKDYDWDPIPTRDISHQKWNPNADIREIGIGDADPVLKFKDWIGQYWLKKQDVSKIRRKNKNKKK